MIQKSLKQFLIASVIVFSLLFILFQWNKDTLMQPSYTVEGKVLAIDTQRMVIEDQEGNNITIYYDEDTQRMDINNKAIDSVSEGQIVLVGYKIDDAQANQADVIVVME
ncbi:MAG: hypothetical protein ACRCZJ_06595 [Erysipelotrichaceae bacterium]